jgi:hypothetical protein
MSKYDKLPYSDAIAKHIKQAVQNGVPMKDVLASVNKRFQNAPRSHATLYKLYGEDIADARAEIVGKVGNVVVQQALEGHFPSQELFLRAKGGWSPTNTVFEGETGGDEDADSSAVDTLMTLLGKKTDVNPDDPTDNG